VRIELQERVGGVTLRQVRDLMRRFVVVSAEDVASSFALEVDGAQRLLHDLVGSGYLEKASPAALSWGQRGVDGAECYEPTELGRRLRNTKAYKRISRSKGMEILKRLRHAIEAINADEALVYRVEEIYVFGSMLNGGEDIGDVDIAFRLEPRNGLAGKELVETNLVRARQSGFRGCRNYVDQLFYGEHEVQRLLKRPSRRISLHEIEELDEMHIAAALFYSRQGGFVKDWHLRPPTRLGGCAGGGG